VVTGWVVLVLFFTRQREQKSKPSQVAVRVCGEVGAVDPAAIFDDPIEALYGWFVATWQAMWLR
jgi:hypothetical protein